MSKPVMRRAARRALQPGRRRLSGSRITIHRARSLPLGADLLMESLAGPTPTACGQKSWLEPRVRPRTGLDDMKNYVSNRCTATRTLLNCRTRRIGPAVGGKSRFPKLLKTLNREITKGSVWGPESALRRQKNGLKYASIESRCELFKCATGGAF